MALVTVRDKYAWPPSNPASRVFASRLRNTDRGYDSNQNALRPRVRLVIDLLHPVRGNMGVDLRRAQAGMTEQRLHRAQIGAIVQQMRREAVPEFVRRDLD